MLDILIIEDNLELGSLLCDFLIAEGYQAQLATDGESGISLYKRKEVRLVILDIMLPNMDGFAVCQKIRETNNTPIIMISAKIEKEDKINGLLLGADDYIEKPYDIDILLAKINGLFKRRYYMNTMVEGDLILDKNTRKLFKNNIEISLTTKEFDLLVLLMENKGRTLHKDMLFNKVWGFDSFSEIQTLTVHIKWLREKIEHNPKKPVRIVTVWGIGYRFDS